MTNPDAPLARALRALQQYDELCGVAVGHRFHLIEAETILGEQLGLTCTGVPSGWNEDGSIAYYDHDGDTCPIHEWLVPADNKELRGIADPAEDIPGAAEERYERRYYG